MALSALSGKMISLTTPSSTIGKAVTNITLNIPVKPLPSLAATPANLGSGDPDFDKFKSFNTTNIYKFVNPYFEKFSRQYAASAPEMLFVSEYIVDGKNLGVLVAWEKLMDSTHYELFKRNLFQVDSKFERILFLDTQNLEEETSHYIEYLKNTVGLDIEEDKIVVILDTIVKEDRIYEYRVHAARVPKGPTEVDYDNILESKNLAKFVSVDETSINTVFDFSGIVLGSKELAWTIAALNEGVSFFGRTALEKSIVSFDLEPKDGERGILLANNLNDILTIMNNSTSLFGIRQTYDHLLKVLGGLGSDFRASFLESIDETQNAFSYDNFTASIKKKVPVFDLVLQVVQSGNTNATGVLSKLSISVPNRTSAEPLSSIENITKVLNFVNATFISVLYSQEQSDKVKQILQEIENGTLSTAVESNTSGAASPVQAFSAVSVPAASSDTASKAIDSSIQSALVTQSVSVPSPSTTASRITADGSSAAVTAPPTSTSLNTSVAATTTSKVATVPSTTIVATTNAIATYSLVQSSLTTSTRVRVV